MPCEVVVSVGIMNDEDPPDRKNLPALVDAAVADTVAGARHPVLIDC